MKRTRAPINTNRDDNALVVITGGGSGGHTVTAVAVIDELLSRFPHLADRLVYIGGLRGMSGEKYGQSVESRIAAEKGLKFVGIRSGKLQRRVAFSTIAGLFGVVGGVIDAIKFFRRNSVRLVFSTGGYVTVPICFAAWLKKVPVVIHEQTTQVGLANKISSYFAQKILVGFEEAMRFLPSQKVTIVGNVIREELTDSYAWPKELVTKIKKMKELVPHYPTVLIAGGGQGAHLFNSIVMMALKSLVSNFNVIVMTGDNKVFRDHDRLLLEIRKLSAEHQHRIFVMKYASAEELGVLYHAADVFVTRGGALMISEAGNLRIPSIIVPIPWVARNEQYFNAKVLENLGLAKIVPEGVLSPEILVQEILRMVSKVKGGIMKIDDDKREKIFVKNAAKRIVDELKELL